MAIKESKIKYLIREYLLEEEILKKNITDPKLDFGFQFTFPPGIDSKGRHRGQMMAVFKPKNKKLIIVSLGTQIAEPHVKALNSLENNKKIQFFMDLRKFFLLKDVFFRIDTQNFRYEISDQRFIKKNGYISKNSFFKSIRKVFNAAAYSNMILGECCAGKIKQEDFSKSKDFSSGSNFSLYS